MVGGRRDVVIVGAGVAGLVTATVLQRAGLNVLVLDRHGIGGVTTRGSTGKLTALQGDTLLQVNKHRGANAAQAYALAVILMGVTVISVVLVERVRRRGDGGWI